MTTRYCPACRFRISDTSRFCAQCGEPVSDPGEDATATIDPAIVSLASGTVFAGRYLILEELGRGGMGRVYRAIDKKIDDEIALKMIRPEIAADSVTLERFGYELKIARKIVHKNVGRMHDLAEDRGYHFITMEYVPGQDLKGLIKQTGRLTVSKTISLAKQICQGLAEAHRLGIVHRDLKPGNIMIDREGNARIMDFGIALSFAGDRPEDKSRGVGTPAYMSPEQLLGKEVDRRADIYSLGIILFEMVTGRRPFSGETAAAAGAKAKEESPPDPLALNPQIPHSLALAIRRCLERERDKRFPDAEALIAELEEIEAGLPAEERPTGGALPKAGSPRPAKRWPLRIAAVLALLAIGSAIAIFLGRGRAIDSIAVLPFDLSAAGSDTEYLGDGVTENIISRLAVLPSLKKVIALSSVFRYKGKTVDPQTVGRELAVDAVLVSHVTRRGAEISLLVELMRVRDNSRIWGRQIPFRLVDLLSIQGQITNSITEELRLSLTGDERSRMSRSFTTSYEAFYAFTEGRYFWSKRTPADIRQAIAHFERAIRIDPRYALAYAGLAQAYCVLPDYGGMAPNEAYPKAKSYALMAIQIDDKLAPARVALAQLYRRFDWNWAAARAEFELALRYDPNDASAHHWYGYDLMCVGRHDEALRQYVRARELDPDSLVIARNYGQALYRAKRYDEAMDVLNAALRAAPEFAFLHFYIGRIHMSRGKYQDTLREFEAEKRLSRGWNYQIDPWIGVVYALMGQPQETRKILEQLLELKKPIFVSPTLLAMLYFRLDQKEKGFEMLDKAYEEHDFETRQLRIETAFDPVRDDPRFQALLKKMGLGD